MNLLYIEHKYKSQAGKQILYTPINNARKMKIIIFRNINVYLLQALYLRNLFVFMRIRMRMEFIKTRLISATFNLFAKVMLMFLGMLV